MRDMALGNYMRLEVETENHSERQKKKKIGVDSWATLISIYVNKTF